LLIAQFIYGEVADTVERMNLSLVLAAQFSAVLLACEVMVSITAAMHSSAPLLYRAQMILKLRASGNRRLLADKLKLMVFYELVHTKRKCTFHLGSLSSVTKKSCFDVSVFCPFWSVHEYLFYLPTHSLFSFLLVTFSTRSSFCADS